MVDVEDIGAVGFSLNLHYHVLENLSRAEVLLAGHPRTGGGRAIGALTCQLLPSGVVQHSH